MVSLGTDLHGSGIFRAWLSATSDGAVAIDADGLVVLHNSAASRVTGLAPDAAIGRPWREVLHLDAPIAELLWSARAREEGTHVVTDILCAQGNLRPAELQATAWHDDDGGPSGVLIVIRDLAVLCRQRSAPASRPGYGALVGEHARMQALYDLIEALGPSDAPVVIEGEHGTGKELVAQLVHARSSRAERPLIGVNCGTAAGPAVETELFGLARSGPGAHAVVGRLEMAHTGTLFLKDVAALSPAAQARLLRFLQSGEFERLGESQARRADVRVLVASTRALADEVRAGRFREDLYYRLKVVRLEVPPLRDRLSDVPLLAEHFLAKHGRPDLVIGPSAAALLQSAPWPGNVRELENAIRHAIAHSRDAGVIGPDRFPADLREPVDARPLRSLAPSRDDRRTQLLRALSSHGGNRTAAARALGIGRATFYRWWREAGL
jgi:PAS domain S-box-containing protein